MAAVTDTGANLKFSMCYVMLRCAVQVFDRPFLFFLIDGTTETVLFQGAVTDPSKAA